MIALVNVVQVGRVGLKPTSLPMGLIYLGSALKKAGYEVKIFYIVDHDIERVGRQIAKLKPLFMGVSVLTGLSTLHNWQISDLVRQLEPSIPIIWGGHHPTATPETCLAEPCIDYVFQGEGESGIVQFARAVEAGKGFEDIPGLAMKKDGKIHKNSPPILTQDLESLDFDLSLLDDPKQFVTGKDQMMMLQSSRGCPFGCGFCHIGQFYSHTYRKFSIDYVLRLATQYRDVCGIKTLHITDDIMFLNERDIEMLRKVRALGLRIGPLALRISHVYKHPEVLDVLKELNVIAVFLAWESGVDRILKLMHKDINQEILFSVVKLFAEKCPEITCFGGGMIGNPTETMEEIHQTTKTAVQLRAIHPNCHFTLQTYLPLPGTEFFEMSVREGMTRPLLPKDWAVLDPMGNKKFRMDWLPWATAKQRKLLVDLSQYYAKITQVRRGGFFTHAVVSLFSAMAAYRNNHLNFKGCEWDFWLFEKLANLRASFQRFI